MEKTMKEVRMEHGHTASEVARWMGVDRRTYTHWETGDRKMPATGLIKFAALYRMDPRDIILPDINDF